MHGMLKLIAKIKASPCAWVKFADKISEMPEALPATLAPRKAEKQLFKEKGKLDNQKEVEKL